jgi:hypothetical protein
MRAVGYGRAETATKAWRATADPDDNRNPLANAIQRLKPDSMDPNDPDDVAWKCDSALRAISAKWMVAISNYQADEREQMEPAWKLAREVKDDPQGLRGYLLKLLASEGPKTETESVVRDGGVLVRWQITNDGRAASGIPTEPPR